MSNLPITYTVDETMKMLDTRAKEDPALGDSFFLKVYRRRQQFARQSEHIATFNGASVIHFGQPEAWVPGLFGGGDYELYAHDPADASKKLGGMIVVGYPTEGNPPKVKVDYKVMQTSSWRGPRGLVFPEMNGEATSTQANYTRTPAVGDGQGQQQGGQPAAVWPEAAVRERDAAAESRRQLELLLERERAERKTEAETTKLRQEMDRVRADAEQRNRDLEAKLTAAATAASARPPVDLAQTVVALMAAATPLITAFMTSGKETREAEARRAEAAAAAQTALLAKLAEPKGMPPEVTMLFEVMKGQATASGEMMSRMVEATSNFNTMSVNMITTMAEHLGGEQGNPILDGAKDIIKTIASMQKGTELAGRRAAQQMVQTAQMAPQALPASQPQYPTAAHMPTHQPPRAQPQGNGAQATGPQMPTQAPVPVTHFAGPTPGTGFDGLPPVGPADSVAAIEGMIRNHDEPARVVDFIISKVNAKDNDLFAALDQHNGDVEALIGDRLGGWAILAPNMAYLDQLGAVWQQKAGEAGLIEDEDAGEAEPAPQP